MVRVRLRDRDRVGVVRIRLGLALGPICSVIFTLILMIHKCKLLARVINGCAVIRLPPIPVGGGREWSVVTSVKPNKH